MSARPVRGGQLALLLKFIIRRYTIGTLDKNDTNNPTMNSGAPAIPRESLNEDVSRLQTVWSNEMSAPELLPYDDDIVSEMLEQLRNQQEYVDSVNEDKTQLTDELAFINKLYQMEIDRLRYMVTSYLRLRLRKIENHATYLLSSPEQTQRLSPKEQDFATQFVNLVTSHVNDLAVGKMAPEHQSLTADGMVQEPNIDHFVFCQSHQNLGDLVIDDRGAESIDFQDNDRHVIRYRTIQNYVLNHQMTLL